MRKPGDKKVKIYKFIFYFSLNIRNEVVIDKERQRRNQLEELGLELIKPLIAERILKGKSGNFHGWHQSLIQSFIDCGFTISKTNPVKRPNPSLVVKKNESLSE